jgi:enediyne biosynthesis protein E4
MRGAWMCGILSIVVGCSNVSPSSPETVAADADQAVVQTKTPAPDAGSALPELFADVTAETGIQHECRTGSEADQFTILETLGAGAAFIDYDCDGWVDIFLAGGGHFGGADKTQILGARCRLYKNLGNWKFREATEEAGLDRDWFYNHGVAIADFDCDGFPDLLVTGYGALALFHNESNADTGSRQFKDVTSQVGLHDRLWSTSAGWGDLNGDRYPDLYVCHYVDWSFANHPICEGHIPGVERDVCPPQRFKALKHSLYTSLPADDGERRFQDDSDAHGFVANGCGLGVVLADVNRDSQPDVYVANDASNNFLFFNRRGKLEEKGLVAGAAVDDQGHVDGSMGVDVGDYDGSGSAALWVTNFQGEFHGLYANLGHEAFDHQSRAAGVAAIGMHLVSFGTGFIDADSDGWEDLVFVNGHVLRHPILGSTFLQRPVLLHNVERNGRRRFVDISARGGPFFSKPALGRGLAVGDLDNDGRPDLVVTHCDAPVAVLRNVSGDAGSAANHWFGIRLVGRDHRDVVGSTITLEGSAGKLTKFAKGGGSYLSASDQRILFGLGQSKEIRSVSVRWSWGETQRWAGLEADSYWELKEGETKAMPIQRAAAD